MTRTHLKAARIKLLPALLLLSVSSSAHSHVKWFTDPQQVPIAAPLPSSLLITGIIGVALILIVAAWLNARLAPVSPAAFAVGNPRILHISHGLLAMYFLGCALGDHWLAPHIRISDHLLYLGVLVQILIYTLLLIRRWCGVTALLTLGLFIVAAFDQPLFIGEYLLLAGIAWLIYSGETLPSRQTLRIIRVALGMSLITLALTEKLLRPDLALAVIEQHPLNFMSALGFNFSDRLYVFCAGLVELLMGVLLVSGWLIRTTIAVLFGFLVASNLYFAVMGAYLLAWMELIGHLPLFALGLLLLCYEPAQIAQHQASSTVEKNSRIASEPIREF